MTTNVACETCNGTGHVEGFQHHAGCTVPEPIRQACPACAPAPATRPIDAAEKASIAAAVDAIPF